MHAGLQDIDVVILRTGIGIAETNSVWLTEAELTVNALAYLAQHLIVLPHPAGIVTNIHRA